MRHGTHLNVLLFVLAVVISGGPPCHAEISTITVDLETKQVNPQTPTVNLWSADTISLAVKGKEERKVYVSIDLHEATEANNIEASDTIEGRLVPITYLRCDDQEFRKPRDTCPAVLRESASWVIWTPPIGFVVQIFSAADDDAYLTPETTIVIDVKRRPFSLGWSAGFSGFFGTEDHRYRLSPIDGDTEMASLERVSDKDLAYKVTAMAHYFPYKWSEVHGPTFGLSTDVPVDKLTILLGWSVSLRTLPIGDGAYLTAGLAYTPRKRLRPEFEGLDKVAANLTSDALLEDDYGLGGFVALSFGFWGGKNKFQGVFSGNGNSE